MCCWKVRPPPSFPHAVQTSAEAEEPSGPWQMLVCDWLPRKWGCGYRVYLPSNRNCQHDRDVGVFFALLFPVCSRPPRVPIAPVATKDQRFTFILIFIPTDSLFDPIQSQGPEKSRLEPPSDLCLDPTT